MADGSGSNWAQIWIKVKSYGLIGTSVAFGLLCRTAQRFSNLDQSKVLRIDRDQRGFRLTLQDGTEVLSSVVVIAAGIGPFKKKPTVFQNLSPQQATHCYEGRDVRRIGAG